MNITIASEIVRELVSRGYGADGAAPNGTMDLDEAYMRSIDVVVAIDAIKAVISRLAT